MRFLRTHKRRGFSLLEMVIALALGMILLLGLYMTLSVTVNHAQTGREVMADGAVARSIMTRINNDISSQISPVDPRVLVSYGIPSSTTQGGIPVTDTLGAANALTEMTGTGAAMTTAGSTSSTSGAGSSGSMSGGTSSSSSGSNSSGTSGSKSSSGSSGSNSSSSGSNSSNSSTQTYPSNGLPAVLYNVGVRGDSTSLILSTYRVRQPPAGQPTDAPDPVIISDVTRVNYWLITNGADTVGLARYEIKQATHTDIDLAIPDISDPNQYLISDEVKNIQFEYFDGATWQQSWDGSVLGGPAGETPIGPPAAIRVTLTLRRNTRQTETVSDYPDDATNTYVHVIALPTSNNPAPRLANTTGN